MSTPIQVQRWTVNTLTCSKRLDSNRMSSRGEDVDDPHLEEAVRRLFKGHEVDAKAIDVDTEDEDVLLGKSRSGAAAVYIGTFKYQEVAVWIKTIPASLSDKEWLEVRLDFQREIILTAHKGRLWWWWGRGGGGRRGGERREERAGEGKEGKGEDKKRRARDRST